MERKAIYQAITEIFNTCELNYVKEEAAITPSLAGLKLFEEPLVKFGSLKDDLFFTGSQEFYILLISIW